MARSGGLLGIIFVFWMVVFFPRWYVLSYTKVWELDQLAGRSWEQQLSVMHPDEMDSLLALKQSIAERGIENDVVVLAKKDPLAPLATESVVARAVLYPIAVRHEPQEGDYGKYVISIISAEKAVVASESSALIDEYWSIP